MIFYNNHTVSHITPLHSSIVHIHYNNPIIDLNVFLIHQLKPVFNKRLQESE